MIEKRKILIPVTVLGVGIIRCDHHLSFGSGEELFAVGLFKPHIRNTSGRARIVTDNKRIALFEIRYSKLKFAYHRIFGGNVAYIEINRHANRVFVSAKFRINDIFTVAMRDGPNPDAISPFNAQRNFHLLNILSGRNDMRKSALHSIYRLVRNKLPLAKRGLFIDRQNDIGTRHGQTQETRQH